MAKAKPDPKDPGPCPQCGDPFAEHRAATPDEYAASINKENPVTLPLRVDTASPAQRAKLGALFVCRGCGYTTRVKADSTDAATDAADA